MKKLTVTTDHTGDELPSMPVSPGGTAGAAGSPTRTLSRPPSMSNSLLKAATRGAATNAATGAAASPGAAAASPSGAAAAPGGATAGAAAASAAENDLSKLASPATPSRSTDRKHVDNAIITKLQKLGMQEQAQAGARVSPDNSPKVPSPKQRERLAVVLDMDECMLHTTSFSEGDTQRYRQEEDRPNLTNRNKNQPLTVTFRMFDGCRGTANLRPHLHWFLDQCAENFDT